MSEICGATTTVPRNMRCRRSLKIQPQFSFSWIPDSGARQRDESCLQVAYPARLIQLFMADSQGGVLVCPSLRDDWVPTKVGPARLRNLEPSTPTDPTPGRAPRSQSIGGGLVRFSPPAKLVEEQWNGEHHALRYARYSTQRRSCAWRLLSQIPIPLTGAKLLADAALDDGRTRAKCTTRDAARGAKRIEPKRPTRSSCCNSKKGTA
ncbi:hypothetical protein PF004_g9329 [Phytophthora fragariae]|uniref:Uncharacterized protein n=1 Tax=Phytophthora fragariae TaxID=53985 RepID=A0A6G0P466_9STRA|nr:hypothetical protein PF004_g9329 [Phytophthora fragariae]